MLEYCNLSLETVSSKKGPLLSKLGKTFELNLVSLVLESAYYCCCCYVYIFIFTAVATNPVIILQVTVITVVNNSVVHPPANDSCF